MSSYRLTYFDSRGRGEIIRWVFAAGKLDYEDVRLEYMGKDWWNLKPTTPFGQIPQLEVDGVKYCQSLSIARYLAKKTGLAGRTPLDEARADMIVDCAEDMFKSLVDTFMGTEATMAAAKKKFEDVQKDTYLGHFEKLLADNKTGFFVGDNLTWADLYVTVVLDAVVLAFEVDFADCPLLKKLRDAVHNQPQIAEWIAKRPVTQF